jgi:hypothetical protein
MAGHILGNIHRLHYRRRRFRRIWARRAELGFPPHALGRSGWVHIAAPLTCNEDWMLLNHVIDTIGQHFLSEHRGRVSRTEAVVAGDPREADLFGEVEQLAGRIGAQDGWLITYTSRAQPR